MNWLDVTVVAIFTIVGVSTGDLTGAVAVGLLLLILGKLNEIKNKVK